MYKTVFLLGAAIASSMAADALAQSFVVTLRAGNVATRYATLPAAVAAAAAARARDAAVPLRFEITGTTRLDGPLILPPAISGTVTAPTTFSGVGKDRSATISGSHRLTLAWKPWRDGIEVADLDAPAFDQLWIDGKRQVRARYPNYDPTAKPFNGVSADALSPARIARWKDPAGGEIHAMHEYRWGSQFIAILGKNPDGTLKLGPAMGNNRVIAPDPTGIHKNQRYVENIFEELDAPGEWYFDARARKLYYVPSRGVDLSNATVEVSALDDLIVVAATEARPVHDVRFENLTITHSARTVMMADERMLRSDWAIARAGAFLLTGAENFTIADSDFRDLGGNGVFVSGYDKGVTVEGNSFRDLGGSAIHFAGLVSATRSPAIGYWTGTKTENLDTTPGPKTDDYPRASTARDNLITDIGVTDKQAAGIAIDIAADITVSHNSIYDVPRAGINIGDGTFGGHLLEYNDIFDTVLESNDHGSFNSWGRDRYWHPDLAYMRARTIADRSLAFLDTVKPITMRRNRWRTEDGFDVDLDDGSSNYIITENVMLRGGLKLREGFDRIVTNNVIINNAIHPHVSFDNSGDRVEHNILMGPYQPINVAVWNKAWDYNLFTNRLSLEEARKLGSDTHSLFGDPMFVDAAHGDYRVKPGSPALRIGFHNFPMDQFGVESPRLKAIAKTPVIPPLLTAGPVVPGKTFDFSGATIKNIETLGEQSALGTDKQGALVVDVPAGTWAAAGGLLKGDVVKSVDVSGSEFPVEDAPMLLVLQASHKWQQRLHLNVFRDHRLIKLEVPYE